MNRRILIDVRDLDALIERSRGSKTERRCVCRCAYSPWQVQTARGWHLYYRHPGVRVGNRAGTIATSEGPLAIHVSGKVPTLPCSTLRAVLVRGFGLSSAEAGTLLRGVNYFCRSADLIVAAQLLWEWAGGRPGWDPEWIAQTVAHAERYGTETIGALR